MKEAWLTLELTNHSNRRNQRQENGCRSDDATRVRLIDLSNEYSKWHEQHDATASTMEKQPFTMMMSFALTGLRIFCLFQNENDSYIS